MSDKHKRIAEIVESCRGRGVDAHYAGYFECFNRTLFYEAHEVLEALWLKDRKGVNGAFYKGLIQLAGAFVHLQKNRPGPAAALLQLARRNLEFYPARHEGLDVEGVLEMIQEWRDRIAGGQGGILSIDIIGAPKLVISMKP